MKTLVWCVLASLLQVLVTGEIYDNVAKSFYEKPESSSPAPKNRLNGMKEFVLYLTPEQAQALKAAGAVVRPFPQFENSFLQHQWQQSIEEQTKSQQQTNENGEKQGMNLDEFYKVFNIQQLNEDLTMQSQSSEQSTEKPRPKYKYIPKPRQQEYASLYVPKKHNKTKTYSTEYVRYLPNYETEDLKMIPYRAKPLPGYNFKDTPTNVEYQTYVPNKEPKVKQPVEIQKHEEVFQHDNLQKSIDNLAHEEIEKPIEIQKHEEVQIPAEYQNHEEIQSPVEVQKYEQFQTSLEVQKHEEVQRPEEIQPIIQVPTRTLAIERGRDQHHEISEEQSVSALENRRPLTFDEILRQPQEIGNRVPIPINTSNDAVVGAFVNKPFTSTPPPNSLSSLDVIQRQYTSLLAPLIQHEKITESIAEQKALIDKERAIQTKLQQIKESGHHDKEKAVAEIDKLNKNLGKQNALAEKIALQSFPKKPQPLLKLERTFPWRRPIEFIPRPEITLPTPVLVRMPEPIEQAVPRPYPVPLPLGRAIPVPVLQPENTEVERPSHIEVGKRIPLPVRNVFINVDKPFLTQKVISVEEFQRDIPAKYPLYQSDQAAILRHIWEH